MNRRSTQLRNITEEKNMLSMGGISYLIANQGQPEIVRKSTYMERISKYNEVFGPYNRPGLV